jgi:hypothetical protein
MTVPHYVNEDRSDMRAIKSGWYAMETTAIFLAGHFPAAGNVSGESISSERIDLDRHLEPSRQIGSSWPICT